MLHRLKLLALIALFVSICSWPDTSSSNVIYFVGPALNSPFNGAYVDGTQITFSWAPTSFAICTDKVTICVDPFCNNILINDSTGYADSTTLTSYTNLDNNGTKYYWKVYRLCIPYNSFDTWIFNSLIGNFTTYDSVTGATVSSTPSSPVVEGDEVTFSVNAQGAPLNDYLYRYLVKTYINGSYSGTQELQAPSTASSFTWTVPPYDSNKTYQLSAEVGTSSYKSYIGSFSWDYVANSLNYSVLPSSTPSITTTSLPDAMLGAAYYTNALSVTGGQPPYFWIKEFPPGVYGSDYIFDGISIDHNTGVISGTPTAWNESYPLTIKVTDSRNLVATKNFIFVVHPALSITNSTLPDSFFNNPYNQTLVATGGKPPYKDWIISSGSLPSGLSLDRNSGALNGTTSSFGNYTFNVKVSDSLNASVEKSFAIYVYPPITINNSSLSSGTIGSSYTQTLTASGGYPGSYCWSLYSGSLPAGLTLSSSGVIGGTPQTAGSYTFTVQVGNTCSNPATIARQQYTVVVYPTISITSNTLSSGKEGNAYSQTLSATGGNGSYVWSISAGSLPAGLTLSTAGIISGTPTTGGDYTFTARVSDTQNPAAATATKQFTINISYLPVTISTVALANGTAGTAYNQTLTATGGKAPYEWTITSGSLPFGWSLDSTNGIGIISGITTDVGSFSFTVQAKDSQTTPVTASQSYLFNVTNGIMQKCTEPGSKTSSSVCTNSTTDVITGVVDHGQELFSTQGAAFGTAIELFYKSMPAYNGPLGIGWSHTYDMFLTVNSDGSIVLQEGIGSKKFYTKSGSSFDSPPGDFSTLTKNADNSYTISYRDGLKKNFRTDGRIASIADRFNNTISFSYTGTDLTGITDQAQRSTVIGYDQATTPHRISTITDPNGKVYDFVYQGNTLWKVINPAANPAISPDRGYWEYSYYPDNLLKSKKDPNGNIGQYTYDANHRMWTATDPEARTRTIVYPATTENLRTSTLTEKDGGQWLYTYDAQNGVIKQKTDPNGKAIKYTYYPNGNLKSSTDPKNGTISLTTFYTYDNYGHLLTRTEPVDLSSYSPAIYPENVADPATLASLSPPIKPALRYAYDTLNYDRISSVSDERVTPYITTNFVYTAENGGEVVTATATPGNYVTVTKRNPNGTVKEIIDANLKSTTFTYYPNNTANLDAGIVGLLWTATDPAGVTTTITSYDKNGNPLEMTVKDTAGTVRLTTVQQHDALNRLNQLTKTATDVALPIIVTAYGYDNMGNLSSLVDAENRETKYEYNYNRQVKKITDAKLNDTVFKYSGSEGNGVDKLVGVYDAKVTKSIPLDSQPHTAFSYDKLGRLEYETDQLGKKMHYTYYDNGQVKEKYDATASTPGTLLVTYSYDNRGQITDKTFTDGTYEHFTYYPDGKLWTATNQNIGYTYTYYTDGRLYTITDTTNNRVISYDEYDGLGQRKKVTILKGAGADQRTITYDYDNANRPWHITSNAGIFTYAYDSLGRRDTLTYPNGTTADWDFDDLNRLTAITHKVTSGATFAAFNYTDYDMVGNRKTVTGSKNETYGYDELYRLLTVTSGNPEGFNYDAVGNRKNGPSPADTVYAHNNANQMTQGRKLGYGYDNRGNQASKTVPGATDKSWIQTWDYQNRLEKVEKTKGTEKRTVTFKYDPLGRRIEKKFVQTKGSFTETETSTYVYDNEDVVMEIFSSAAGTEKTNFTHGPGIDEPLSLERQINGGASNFYYYHADGLGSISTITNAAKAVVQSYEYDSYGMVKPNTAFRNSYVYTGREWDSETGLYFHRARYYDPMDGKFVSKDPIGFEGGLNLYQYTSSNPLNYIDPFGLDKMTDELRENAVGLEEPFFLADPINYVGGLAGVATKVIRGTLAKKGSQCVTQAVRSEASNLSEQLTMEEAKAGAGSRIMQGKINDSRYPEDIWAKIQHTHTTPEGTNIVVHYWQNLVSGIRTGFKFKNL